MIKLKWTKEKVVEELKKVKGILGRSPTYSQVRKLNSPLVNACESYFGGFNKAKEAAKLKTNRTGGLKYELPGSAKRITPQLGYIIGVLLGDGYSWGGHIKLEVKDKDFAAYFKRVIENWAKKGTSYEHFHENCKKKFPDGKIYNINSTTHRVVLYSIEASNFLRKKLGNLSWLNRSPREVKRMTLKGLWDSEGCVDKNDGVICFINKDLTILNLFKNLCSEFGIKSSKIIKRERSKEVKIFRNSSRAKFLREIGTSIKRKKIIIKRHIKTEKSGLMWDEDEKLLVYKKWRNMSDEGLAKEIKRSAKAVKHFRCNNRLLRW